MKLFHYTCDHGAQGINRDGHLIPSPHVLLGERGLVWLTHNPFASRSALGLTSHILDCDRMAHRFVADDAGVVAWTQARHLFPADAVRLLEEAPAARPDWWWLGFAPLVAKAG